MKRPYATSFFALTGAFEAVPAAISACLGRPRYTSAAAQDAADDVITPKDDDHAEVALDLAAHERSAARAVSPRLYLSIFSSSAMSASEENITFSSSAMSAEENITWSCFSIDRPRTLSLPININQGFTFLACC